MTYNDWQEEAIEMNSYPDPLWAYDTVFKLAYTPKIWSVKLPSMTFKKYIERGKSYGS